MYIIDLNAVVMSTQLHSNRIMEKAGTSEGIKNANKQTFPCSLSTRFFCLIFRAGLFKKHKNCHWASAHWPRSWAVPQLTGILLSWAQTGRSWITTLWQNRSRLILASTQSHELVPRRYFQPNPHVWKEHKLVNDRNGHKILAQDTEIDAERWPEGVRLWPVHHDTLHHCSQDVFTRLE